MLTRFSRNFPAADFLSRAATLLGGSLLTLALALAGRPAGAQVNPKIQPYRTIEVQQIRPNMQMIVDRSGSMSFDMTGLCRDGLAEPSCSGNYACGAGQPNPRCCQTTFEANCYGISNPGPEFKDGAWTCRSCGVGKGNWFWVTPSRMAILKNVLGAGVTIRDYLTGAPDPGCNNGTSNMTLSPPQCGGVIIPGGAGSTDPGPDVIPPAKLIDKNSIRVNVGFENFAALGNSFGANNTVVMNPALTQTVCSGVPNEAAWADAYLLSAYTGGAPLIGSGQTVTADFCGYGSNITALAPYRGTPTRAGIELAGLAHTAVALGTSQTADICSTTSFTVTVDSLTPGAADPQRVCNRPLFNLLLTDGQSNLCNTANGNDNSITYPACTAPLTPAVGGTPSRRTDILYNNGNTTGSNVSIRTMVVGISTDLTNANAQQELRLDAYFGKSDHADPYALAGLKLTQAYDTSGNVIPNVNYPADPYLRDNTQYVLADATNSAAAVQAAGASCTTPVGKPMICNGTGYICTHEYNFTATSSAELADALKAAFDAVASGDYTTETPSIAQGVTSAGGSQDLIYTASSEFPSYFGHLRAQDLNQCINSFGATVICSDPTALGFKVLWDAGAEMHNTTLNPLGTTQTDNNSHTAYYSTRQIFTYDMTGAVQGTKTETTYQFLPLLPFTTANRSTIGTIYQTVSGQSSANITDPMINFVRGYDPDTGLPRPWQLGDVINSSPVVLAPPANFRLGSTVNHASFVSAYNIRRPLILMGASDGMVHAFDAGFGFEVWAFVPPDSLPSLLQEYNNFSAAGSTLAMGQTTDTATHVFGVASQINVGDVDLNAPDNTAGCIGTDTTTCISNWRTIAVAGLGKGGKAVFALDVTSSFVGRTYKTVVLPDDPIINTYQNDNNNSATFKLLWYKNKNSAGFTDLGETWSSPAISLDSEPNGNSPPVIGRWIVTFGSGPNGDCGNYATCPPVVASGHYTKGVHFHAVKALDGTAVVAATQMGTDDASALIGASLKATNSTYSTQTINFADQVVDKSYQGDLAGRMHEVDLTSSTPASWTRGQIWPCADGSTTTCAATGTGNNQPIYNSPAIGFYKDAYAAGGDNNKRRISIHAWASGEFTETRPEVNDMLCGTGGTHPACFSENMYVSLFDYQVLAPDTGSVGLLGRYTTTIPLTGLQYQRSATDTTLSTYTNKARILGSPSIFIPVIMAEDNKTIALWPKARDITILYTAYDPTQGGCSGESTFILVKPCGANDSCVGVSGYAAAAATYAQFASTGVASSPIVYRGQIIMNVSSKYSYAAARIAGLNAFTTGSVSDDPILGAWREVF